MWLFWFLLICLGFVVVIDCFGFGMLFDLGLSGFVIFCVRRLVYYRFWWVCV